MYLNERTQPIYCINDEYPFLTIGKKYDVLSNMDNGYLIVSDNGLVEVYKKEHFHTLIEKRDQLINSLV